MTTDKPAAGKAKAVRKRTKLAPAIRDANSEGKVPKHWRTYFLAALIETSNVKASADQAGISPSRAYKVKREEPDFAAQWRAALFEGYEHLEMETLAYLRDPQPEFKKDVAAAIRLLLHHRDEVAGQRALEDNRSEQEVLDSIDAMIGEMRERAAANAALLAPTQAETGDEDS
jgi:hypothetical protein